ncbi:Sensors of blue-light using FAD [Hymenobacter daecheongensis DSM 21074]|uniref:Sensors of blue-light using FAD n=1 Tax=Hymenobacter daecheongensis DSM 21074 TaxID=1121955 RepID=A0A1M6EML8_9BACT|nr:BLUF domain-containing protein [Hymenobacter daecheongensis]SHI86673.1 Sensors of blue-light using FAD [Hymenobacter daecheongensis DSM 21074]
MPTPTLFHLVYQSTATTPFTDQELEALLIQSRAWNTAHNLTGVLLYSHGDIMQVLEGSQEEVHYIFKRIARDFRHARLMKLSDGPIEQRNFSQWSMGFKAVDPQDFDHLTGYLNLAKPDTLPTNSDHNSTSLHALLASFVTEGEIRY